MESQSFNTERRYLLTTKQTILLTHKVSSSKTNTALLSSAIKEILMASSRLTPEASLSSKGRDSHLNQKDQLPEVGPIRIDLVQIVTVRRLFIQKILKAKLSLIAEASPHQSMSVIQRLTKLRRTNRTDL